MKKTICLNMIVKDEHHVIERCLKSVKPIIDYWVIVDTGSADGTQKIIKEYLKDIPGDLHERPWVNFGHNRQEAKQLAAGKADYLFFIDADDELVYDQEFALPALTDDVYLISQRIFNEDGWSPHEHYIVGLIKNNDKHEWRGAVHEHVYREDAENNTIGHLEKVYNKYNADSSRNKDPHKCEKDIAILKDAIAKNPLSFRDSLYLARTYFFLERYQEAIPLFLIHSKLGDDPAEVYYSLLYVAICQMRLGLPQELFLDSFTTAYLYRPSRAEAIYEVARHYYNMGAYALSYLFAKRASFIPMTEDTLFIEKWVYEWGAHLYLFLSAHRLRKTEEARSALEMIMTEGKIPQSVKNDFKLGKLYHQYRKNESNF